MAKGALHVTDPIIPGIAASAGNQREAGPLSAKGPAEAEIARGFFDIQLRYADMLSSRAGQPLAEVITWHTNLHRLFAFGNLSKEAPAPAFLELAENAASIRQPAERLNYLINAYATRPFDDWPSDRFRSGNHFSCEAPGNDGAVRIHFRNRANPDPVGPLDASNFEKRRSELAAMFAFITGRWPQATVIEGASWLYNLEAYRRLFPAAYAHSRSPKTGPRPTHGLSTWGQFINFRGALKDSIGQRFLASLPQLDPAEPWRIFPYQVLVTRAPLEAFRREYGV